MIIDLLFGPVVQAADGALGTLPAGQPLDLPAIAPLWNLVAGLDSIVPILGPLTVMLGVLAFGALFVVVRLVLTLWNLVWP